MTPFVIFLLLAGLNTGAGVAVSRSNQIPVPVVIVVEDATMYPYAPVVTFDASKRDGFFFEVDYLTPVGQVSFRSVTTNKHYDFVYGASCFVRVRLTNGVFHGDWSKPQFVSQIVPTTTQASSFVF
jgi:hypothetical protein